MHKIFSSKNKTLNIKLIEFLIFTYRYIYSELKFSLFLTNNLLLIYRRVISVKIIDTLKHKFKN